MNFHQLLLCLQPCTPRKLFAAAPAMSMATICALSGACTTYQPMPLTKDAVERSLQPATAAALRIDAGQLRHPLLPAVTFDGSDEVTPDRAAVLAVLANPQLRAERDRLGIADAQLLQAHILPNPELSLSRDNPVGGTAGLVSAFAAGVGWSINDLITRHSRIRAATAGRASVALDVAWQEWQVAESAKTACYDVLGLEAEERVASEIDSLMAENLAVVRRGTGSGQLTEVDLAAAKAASLQANRNLLQVRASAHAQRLALNLLLGLPASSRLEIAAGVELPLRIDPPAEKALLDGLEERRLDLQALRKGYESQDAALRAAILGQFPRLVPGAGRARDTGDVTTNSLSVTLSLPLFDRNQGAIAAAKATRQQMFDIYASRVLEARSAVTTGLAQIRSLDEQLEAAQQAETVLQHLVDTDRTALAAGQADVLSYYTAWNNYGSARLQTLALRRQLLGAQVALELATGLYQLDGATSAPAARPNHGEEHRP